MSGKPDSNSDNEKNEFEEAAEGKQLSLFGEFLVFVVENKRWWLVPILLVLALLGLLVMLSWTGAAPFIYTVF